MDDMNHNNPQEQSEQPLEQELEALKETFQQAYDETAEEAQALNGEPVLQELEEETEEDSRESEDYEDEDDSTPIVAPKPKKKHKVALGIFIALLSVLLLVFGAYFVVTIVEPDFVAYATAYTTAESAGNPSDAVSAYETALTYCTEDSKLLYAMKEDILEKIVYKTAEADGYSAAKSYMETNFSDEMKEKPSKKMQEFLNAANNIDIIADSVFDTVKEQLGDADTAENFDTALVLTKLNVSPYLKSDMELVITKLAEGMAAEKKAENKEDFQNAITSYFNAYQSLTGLDVTGQKLMEIIVTKMFDNGYAYEAQMIYNNYFSDDMKTEVKLKGFNKTLSELESISGFEGNIYELGVAFLEKGLFTAEDGLSYEDEALNKLSDGAKKAVAGMAATIAEGLKYEKEKNLTAALTDFQTALSALETFEFTAPELNIKTVITMFITGDISGAYEAKGTYITEDVLKTVAEEEQAVLDDIDTYYNAYNAAYEVFYPSYYSLYSSGTAMDKDEVNKSLDTLITADASDVLGGYVAYFKYATESCTDGDTATMLKYLEEFKFLVGDTYPMTYGYDLIGIYKQGGKFDSASEIAESILSVNIADEFANSVKAFDLRRTGDVDGALELAKKGAELSGEISYCAYEITVDSVLKGDWETAFDYAKQLYDASLTLDHCEIIKVINALNDLPEGDLKTEIATLNNEVDSILEQYSVTLSDNCQAIIDGTKTAEDVFLKEPFNFS